MKCWKILAAGSVFFWALSAAPWPATAQAAGTAKPRGNEKAAKRAPLRRTAAAAAGTAVSASTLGPWRGNPRLARFAKRYRPPSQRWKRVFGKDASLAEARRLAASPTQALGALTVDTLARVLYVLEAESPADARSFQGKVARLYKASRKTGDLDRLEALEAQVKFYHSKYDVPCRGRVARRGTEWPPLYLCQDRVHGTTGEPWPLVSLQPAPLVLRVPPSNIGAAERQARADPKLAGERKVLLARRDRTALPHENLRVPAPAEFCYRDKCYRGYPEVAAAIYGRLGRSANMPVFCAPRNLARFGQPPVWERGRVACSAQWLDTVGDPPWKQSGDPNMEYSIPRIPPYACFGSPHLLRKHMALPAGGAAGNTGFHCRHRMFRVMVKKGEKSAQDQGRNIAMMCAEMRMQVWGEKYPSINRDYQEWCRKHPGFVKRGLCLPPGSPIPGKRGAPRLPFMLLSREELLYFFGHRDLYCRADRRGLIHRLDPEHREGWAKTFTCAVPRGLLEAGPFEEGVQVCAIAPFAGEEAPGGHLGAEYLKARLHCWKFDRPTCEEVSRDQTKDDIHRSNVFDVLDALREARRTHHKDAWGLYDLKDAEKLQDWQERLAFHDTTKDESTFGVKEFCRFAGRIDDIRCGYTKDSMARWYELRKDEETEGCDRGVCARGAYGRGYYCGLFQSPAYFATASEFPRGRPFWGCGIDTGLAGRRLLRGSQVICVGGAPAKRFQSSRGDKSSLQCYARLFRWGESQETEGLLRKLDWPGIVREAAKARPSFDPWLSESGVVAGGPVLGELKKRREDLQAFLKKTAELEKGSARIHGIWYYDGAYMARAVGAFLPTVNKILGIRAAVPRWSTGCARHGHCYNHQVMMTLISVLQTVGKAQLKDVEERIQAHQKGLGEAEQALMDLAARDGKDLVEWARRRGHTLGHRTSLRLALMRSGISAVKEFMALQPRALKPEKATALTELLDEVRSGSRPADGRWYQSFRIEAAEEGRLQIPGSQLTTALRIHHLHEVLEAARRELLEQAKKYAATVLATARRAKLLSRVELLERARASAIREKLKGNVFCIRDPQPRKATGIEDHLCASSPLLVAGEVERDVEAKWRLSGPQKASEDETKVKAQREKIRAKVKFGWCYGGLRAKPLRGYTRAPALSERNLSSPYYMDVPASVVWRRQIRGTTFRYNGMNWLKCAGFSYSDERWDEADPQRWKALQGPKLEAKTDFDTAAAQADRHTAKITDRVGGLLGALINMALPHFANAIDRVRDLSNLATEFYDKYLSKFVEKARAMWEDQQQRVKDAADALQEVKEKLREEEKNADQAKEQFWRAQVEAAAALGPAKEKAEEKKNERKQEWDEAKKRVKEALAAIREKEGALKAATAAAQSARAPEGTGEILNEMLEDLVQVVTERLSAVVEPHARDLVGRAFKFVRAILDPIAKAVVGSLAAIPFVGAGLAPLGQEAYSMALSALEDGAFGALRGIVERILAKLVRLVITPAFKAVQSKILELAYGVCARLFPTSCPRDGKLRFSALPPRDRWLERSLACPGPPIFDEKLYRDALAAHAQILETARQMRGEVALLSRDLADRYLGRFGYDLSSWLAAAGNPNPTVIAQATAMERKLRRMAERLRGRGKREGRQR